MKTFPLAAACCALLLAAGCESGIPDDMRSALGPRQSPRTRVFKADQKAAYDAAKAAVKDMGFRFARGGPAQGELEALSEISRGDNAGSSRQISMKVRLSPGPESGTEVEVSLVEIIEENTANQQGAATQTPLRDTPLYEVFFRDVQTALSGGR